MARGNCVARFAGQPTPQLIQMLTERTASGRTRKRGDRRSSEAASTTRPGSAKSRCTYGQRNRPPSRGTPRRS